MSNIRDFFTSVTTDQPANLSITDEAEACAAVLFACQRADEINGKNGQAAFRNTLKNRNIFIGTDPELLMVSVGKCFEAAGSSAALIDAAIGAIREQTRLPLFYHCLDVILADGLVTPQEDKVFKYLKKKFKVHDEIADRALEVLVVKNQL